MGHGIDDALRIGMTWQERLRKRTFAFSLAAVRFTRSVPHSTEGDVIRGQLIRSATGVGANYRATCRGRSDAEKRAKIGVAIEEADESGFWLELLTELNLGEAEKRKELLQEANELTALLVACRRSM